MGWKFSFQNRMFTLAVVCVCFFVTGCRQFQTPWVPEPKCPNPLTFNFVQCPEREPCSDTEKCNFIAKLEANDVKIIRVGEEMKIVISSDRLFEPWSANFVPQYQCVLSHLASYLWCYRKVDVKIYGYTDCYKDPEFNQKLSLLQAQRVATYLWSRGINARLVHTRGYGRNHRIADVDTYYQRSRNRRIEINFRDIPDTK